MMQNTVPAGGYVSTVRGYLPLFFLIVGQCLPGQTGPPENSTTSVKCEPAVLHAAVPDKNGGFVAGLQKEDFHVYLVFEDGVLEVIEVFDHEDVPVAVGL